MEIRWRSWPAKSVTDVARALIVSVAFFDLQHRIELFDGRPRLRSLTSSPPGERATRWTCSLASQPQTSPYSRVSASATSCISWRCKLDASMTMILARWLTIVNADVRQRGKKVEPLSLSCHDLT